MQQKLHTMEDDLNDALTMHDEVLKVRSNSTKCSNRTRLGLFLYMLVVRAYSAVFVVP